MGRARSHHASGLDALAENVLRLSRLLTRDRDDLPAAYLHDRALRDAYVSYFLPANLAKVHLPLRELDRHPARLLQRERLRVLDLGCGPGTSALGVLEFFSCRKERPVLEFVALDQVPENLREAEQLFQEAMPGYPGTALLRAVRSGVSTRICEGEAAFDIIILSNVLNELFHGEEERIGKRIELIAHILDRLLAPDGSCIIIEPALRETSRELLMVRDGLIARGLTVYSPCFMQQNCPALANPRDWCHEDVPWEAPDLIREIDERIGLRKDALKFSYVVFRKEGSTLADLCGSAALRVVSAPLVSKGKREVYVCGRGGRMIAMRQDKDRSSSNAAFDQLLRGMVVRFEGLLGEGKRFRVGRETRIGIVSLPGGEEKKT